ncbi:flavin reductase family protein [Nocardioides zeae]|uniref:Flavin reductase family protein n=1 Tax=Nocardioides imazamoxiresistens TaxID=3231893 RepID=A0ABU3PTM5_9ACTN|nr:flavin reductase family protein [Nocardioides zeae]MDT9592197.1 flavin reductase family protein [Nocardioides zeae]
MTPATAPPVIPPLQPTDFIDDHAPSWRPAAPEPAQIDIADFATMFRHQPAGVAVLTADPGDGPVAMTATSVASVSVDPPLLAFSVSTSSSAAPGLLHARTLVVHLLDEDDIGVAQLCATSGVDRYADGSTWSRLPTGEPHFHDVRRWLRVRPVRVVEVPGATVVVAEALLASSTAAGTARPLVYHHRTWHVLDESSVAH